MSGLDDGAMRASAAFFLAVVAVGGGIAAGGGRERLGHVVRGEHYRGVILSPESFEQGDHFLEFGKLAGAWTPSDEDIEALESRLPDWFDRHTTGDRRDLTHCRRQYVGVVRKDGAKLIYLNCVAATPLRSWKKDLMFCFDGGSGCWRALYDVEQHEFIGYAENGVAG
jgi:hypothetical protein